MNDKQPLLFRATCCHGPGCGMPPEINGNIPGRRYSHFQNEYGEQAIFEYNLETKTGRLWMGDVGWEQPHEVVNGFVPDLVLSPSEALWVEHVGTLPLASYPRHRMKTGTPGVTYEKAVRENL